jgi:uncharacterized membrane protein YbhN (UPF0104 family)
MKKSLLTILQYLFFLGLGFLFVWLTIRDLTRDDWALIKLSVQNARHWLVIPVICLLFLSHYSRAVRWKLLMEPLGYKPSTFNTFAAVMIGYLVNAGVPRLGEVVKCTILSRYEKVRADKLVGTIVVERLVDLISLIIIFTLALIFQGHIIGDFTLRLFGNFFKNSAGETSLTKLFVFLSFVVFFCVLFYFLLKRFAHIDAIAKVTRVLVGIRHGLGSIRLIRHKGLFLFHSVLIWVLYLASTTIGIYALRETEHLGIGGGLTTLGIGSIGMIITPGGIGAYPLLVSELIGLYGLDAKTTGRALGWLLWSVQTIIILGGGLIFFGLLSYYNKKQQTLESIQQHP